MKVHRTIRTLLTTAGVGLISALTFACSSAPIEDEEPAVSEKERLGEAQSALLRW
jgi:hypothetical protein